MSTNANGPFRADHVGSLLRPTKLQQARMQHERKNVTAQRLREIEDESEKMSALKVLLTASFGTITGTSIFLTELAGSCSKRGITRWKWHR